MIEPQNLAAAMQIDPPRDSAFESKEAELGAKLIAWKEREEHLTVTRSLSEKAIRFKVNELKEARAAARKLIRAAQDNLQSTKSFRNKTVREQREARMFVSRVINAQKRMKAKVRKQLIAKPDISPLIPFPTVLTYTTDNARQVIEIQSQVGHIRSRKMNSILDDAIDD